MPAARFIITAPGLGDKPRALGAPLLEICAMLERTTIGARATALYARLKHIEEEKHG